MKNKLAMFDFDGTLFNTEPLIYFSYKKAIEENHYSFNVTVEEFRKIANGKTYRNWLPLFLEEMGKEEMEKIHDRKNEIYQQHLELINPNHSLFSLIETIKPFYYIGLMTTSIRKNVNTVLNLFDKYDVFDYIITAEDVEKEKPDPECYIKGMQHFNIAPENTIIFEDSPIGIQAARASKASVYIVDKFES